MSRYHIHVHNCLYANVCLCTSYVYACIYIYTYVCINSLFKYLQHIHACSHAYPACLASSAISPPLWRPIEVSSLSSKWRRISTPVAGVRSAEIAVLGHDHLGTAWCDDLLGDLKAKSNVSGLVWVCQSDMLVPVWNVAPAENDWLL